MVVYIFVGFWALTKDMVVKGGSVLQNVVPLGDIVFESCCSSFLLLSLRDEDDDREGLLCAFDRGGLPVKTSSSDVGSGPGLEG